MGTWDEKNTDLWVYRVPTSALLYGYVVRATRSVAPEEPAHDHGRIDHGRIDHEGGGIGQGWTTPGHPHPAL